MHSVGTTLRAAAAVGWVTLVYLVYYWNFAVALFHTQPEARLLLERLRGAG
ncbi:MAG: hypothetical protein ABI743_09495 [bacterium]